MAIKVCPFAVLSVFNSTAQTFDGARAESVVPVTNVPIKIPEPFKKLRRVKGISIFGINPCPSSHSLTLEIVASAFTIETTRIFFSC
jgi:hypothetical protein